MINIIAKTRDLIGDMLSTYGRDNYTYESITSSKIFSLTESNISASTILVYLNGVLWADTNYSYDSATGKLTITGALVAGDSLEVTYSYYSKYSDTELEGYIRAAVAYLAIEQYKTFAVKPPNIIFPTPTEAEEYLLAIIAAILIKGNIRQYRTPEITVIFNENESPEKRIRKAVRQFKKTFGVIDYIDPTENITEEDCSG